MTTRRDLSQIKPSDLVWGTYDGSSIIETLVLASSNVLREYLNLRTEDLLPQPIPKFVTRKDPSLDNYCADLLLRTLYEPASTLPTYEEHIIRDDQKVLASSHNPRLVGSVLIGIGGQSNNPDFMAVYDEHAEAGTRGADSATRVVVNRHLVKPEHDAVRRALQPLLDEVDWVDAHGGTPGNHLSKLVKNLHVARFSQPGFVWENLEPQWKRAILSTILSATCIATETLQAATYDYTAVADEVKKEYDAYIQKRTRIVEGRYLPEISERTFDYCREQFTKATASQVHKKPSLMTPGKILIALRSVWPAKVVSFILGFIIEASLQTQEEFYRLTAARIPMKKLPNGNWMIYYELDPDDMVPHRALASKLNNDRKAGIVIIHNPFRQITGIFRSNLLSEKKWRAFVKALQDREGTDIWYAMVQDSGKLSDWVLNGTGSFVGVPMTSLGEEDYAKILGAIKD